MQLSTFTNHHIQGAHFRYTNVQGVQNWSQEISTATKPQEC